MAVFWSLFWLAVYLINDWFAAKEFKQFAAHKGYTDKKYFWWCFLIPPVGYAMVIAMPNRNNDNTVVDLDELPGL